MCDMRNYSRTFVEEFIELYQSFKCLWQIKSKDYSNRYLRSEAYTTLVEKLREVEPEADKDAVIKKINSLRSSFRRELKKVTETKRSGVSADEVYEPRLWYYDLLLFTAEHELQRKSKSSMDDGRTDEEEEINESESNETRSVENPEIMASPPLKTKKKSNKKEKPEDIALNKAYSILSQPDDACEVFGRNVASKLRNMDRLQRLAAEKIINDTLFYGELGKLNLPLPPQLIPLHPENLKHPSSTMQSPGSNYSNPSTYSNPSSYSNPSTYSIPFQDEIDTYVNL